MTHVWRSGLQDTTLNETAWEREMNISGMRTYESKREGQEAERTQAGDRMIRGMLKGASEAIRGLQVDTCSPEKKKDRDVRATLLILPPEGLALITLRALMSRTYNTDEPEYGAPLQRTSQYIGGAVETELNFRNWIDDSKESANEYALEKGMSKAPISLAERLIKEQSVNRSTMFRWKQAFTALSAYQWKTSEKVYCGEALIMALVSWFPNEFQIEFQRKATSKQKYVKMTDEFRARFDQLETRIASMQVVKKPMITKPKAWGKEQ